MSNNKNEGRCFNTLSFGVSSYVAIDKEKVAALQTVNIMD